METWVLDCSEISAVTQSIEMLSCGQNGVRDTSFNLLKQQSMFQNGGEKSVRVILSSSFSSKIILLILFLVQTSRKR